MDGSDRTDRVDELANDLDEIQTTVDELKEDPPHGAKPETIDALHDALEKAREAADDLEDAER